MIPQLEYTRTQWIPEGRDFDRARAPIAAAPAARPIDWPHYSTQTGGGDSVRDLDSFEDAGDIPNISSVDLERLFRAISVTPVSATEWRWKSDWKVGPRSIHDSMWFYVLEGSGQGWTGNSADRFSYRPGTLILLPPKRKHLIEATCPTHVVAVHFHVRAFSAIDVLTLLGMPAAWTDLDNSFGTASMRLVKEFALKKPGWTVAMQADICSVIFQMIRAGVMRLKPDVMLSSFSEIPRLLPVFQHVEENLHDPELSVNRMARCANLSEVQFRKKFRKITGDTPLHFVRRRRVERACSMLYGSDDSVTNIAEACGFSDAPFFHRVFKASTGVTPRHYRNGDHH